MVGKLKNSSRALHERRCVRCGRPTRRSDPGLDEFFDWRCAGCGESFFDRPPRSYAEMEGLDGSVVLHRQEMEAASYSARMPSVRLRRRWIAFLTIVMAVAVMVLFLTAEMLRAM